MRDPIPNRLSYPKRRWVCPVTQVPIPKDVLANVRWRRQMKQRYDLHPEQRGTMIAMCRQSFLLWCNLWAWTYRVRETDEQGRSLAVREEGAHVPFVTWPVQDEAAHEIIAAIEQGRDLIIDKSRDMGASWLLVAVFHWLWLFRKDAQLREISRKEEYVDDGSPKSLFWKHDYLNRYLPPWMVPKSTRKAMHLANKATGGVLLGESTNKDAGRGDRATAILIDEAAAIDKLEPVLRATDQAGPRIFNSTPAGPGTFAELRFSGKVQVVVLPWYRHPEKGRGATCTIDASGKMVWDGPARQQAVKTRTAREVAQNWDMDHAAAGAMFFDPHMLATHKATYACPPLREGTLQWPQSDRRVAFDQAMRRGEPAIAFVQATAGMRVPVHLKLWFDDAPLPDWRPVIGVDISHGAGASQSCACAADANTGEKLAELVDADLDPVAFADLVVMLGWWLGAGGGSGASLIVPEANGPGGMFIRRLQQLEYPHIYRHIPTGKSADISGKQLGWVSNRQDKADKLAQYAQALAGGRVMNRSAYALSQCEQYVYLKSGAIGPGTHEAADGSAKAVHGDIVIADMLMVEGMFRVGRYEVPVHQPPPMSIAWRLQQLAAQQRDPEEW